MSRRWHSLPALAVLAAVAFGSAWLQRPVEHCLLDGAPLGAVSRVRLTDEDGRRFDFCSPCCARRYLDEHPALMEALAAGRGRILVVDAVRGEEMDGSLAYCIAGGPPAVRHNQCAVQVFREAGEAAAHLARHGGRELPGFLAGQGRRLDWAADFCLIAVGGEKHCLGELRGRVVFLRFWSLANPFTREDLAALEQARREFAGRGFAVLAVNVADPPAEVIRAKEELSPGYPMLLDTDGRVADLYGVSGFPSGFLIDRAGVIGRRIAGEVPAELMRPLLHEFL